MRHLRSILYTLVLAPAAWILCGVGFDQDLTGRARDNGGVESLGGLLLLLLAGAAYGILLLAHISPAGPLLAGLGFLGIGAWARIAPESYAGVWPADVTKAGFNLSTPGYGLVVLLAVPLVATALSARRWAGYEPPEVVLIGTLGRVRGAATAPGTPMAAERTTVFAAPPPPRPVPQQQRQRPPIRDEEEKTTLLAALFPAAKEEPTRDVAQSEERTTVLPRAAPDNEKTEVIRSEAATVEVPGDRTQLLTLPTASAGPAASAGPDASAGSPGEETTKSMSITGAERPDPAQDPTTRLSAVAPPGETTTRASRTSTVADLERPADEAADDTRPLSLPAPRPPADDEPTTRL